ncbi:uncharacterized protein LOC111047957 [Nilaparvata lugens]|uniref:uncharacterized protein LOC111047957 n=1 Tax=Nilaparvata lugens TaxID=108931 RepID=UPI00193E9B14|nr:uncharacterized protein LOC111047957 [Nilaparvata lugens]XP_039280714.1 uncharacterized protein LOC111047957 [Nilaparvata lugens]
MEQNENILQRKGKMAPAMPRPPSRVRTTGRETIEFSVRGPLPVNIDEEPVTIPGCSILDLVFGAGGAVVGEVTFRNYYTASVSVLVRCAPSPPSPSRSTAESAVSSNAAGEWRLAIARKELMPQPHLEHGSHSLVSVVVTESTIDWNSLLAIRLVLRQPSPVWRVFHVEELNVYADLPRLSLLKSDVANFTFNQQQQPQHNQQHYDKMLSLVRRQTLAALSWIPPEPPQGGATTPGGANAHPPYSKATCGYELTKLPQI